MSSTFKQVYNLLKHTEHSPIEDYLTEIAAPIFEKEEILLSFLKRFANKHFLDIHDIKVTTQKTYVKLETHLSDSRPDLVITYKNRDERHLIFIENKLGSEEGYLQLQRYYDHLQRHAISDYRTHLFYITQYYDPKNIEKEENKKNDTSFNQLQWYEVFNWLKQFEDDLYCSQVIKYMEEIGLNKSRKFLPQDIYAIQNMSKTITMLDDCLSGKVNESFTRFFGKPKQWTHRTYQLRENERYVIINDQSDWKSVGCGFWLTDGDYPELTVFIEVNPNCRSKEKLLQAFEKFQIENKDWIVEGPDDQSGWFILSVGKSLVDFLAGKDHIDSIQDFFCSKLKELYQLKEAYPELKWSGNSTVMEEK